MLLKDKTILKEFSDSQSQIYKGAVQSHLALLEALRQSRPFRGGMHWKKIRGREYLYQYRDRLGNGRSLGPRSEQTEQFFTEFCREREAAGERLRTQRRLWLDQTRFCRAARLHRVPRPVIKILGQVEQHDRLKGNLLVIGSHAVHAYEFATGAFLERRPLAGESFPNPGSLDLATDTGVSGADLLDLVRRSDRSFQVLGGAGFRAVNKHGFQVTVWTPGHPGRGVGTGSPAAISGLHDLVASPKFSQVVIGRDGNPATLVAPDPRAFALHRLWLSEQQWRPETKQARDRWLAFAVADLILKFLPQYYFFSADLRRFPAEVVRQAADFTEDADLAAGLDIEY